MKDDERKLNKRIAQRVGELRAACGFSLETLAERSGVSRSMISLIERGESNPTAVVLDKLASALGLTLASLFEKVAADENAMPRPLARRREQAGWRDPASGYLRRNLSPDGMALPLRLVEVLFPPGARVAFESQGRKMHQQVWMLEGSMEITTGKEAYRLEKGDCLCMSLEQPAVFHNPGSKTARYLLAACPESSPGK